MEINLSQKVFYETSVSPKKGDKTKQPQKLFQLSSSLSTVKLWLKNNVHQDAYHFFRAMKYKFDTNPNYVWLAHIFDNVSKNRMDPIKIVGSSSCKYEIFDEAFCGKRPLSSLKDEIPQKYLYYLLMMASENQSMLPTFCSTTPTKPILVLTPIVTRYSLLLEIWINFLYDLHVEMNPKYEIEYLILCVDVFYMSDRMLPKSIMKRMKQILYDKKEKTPSNSAVDRKINDYSEPIRSLRVKYHILKAFRHILTNKTPKLESEYQEIECLTDNNILSNFLKVFYHIKHNNMKDCIPIIKDLRERNIRIAGRSELYFAKVFLTHLEISILLKNNRFKLATVMLQKVFNDPVISAKSYKIFGPISYLLAHFCFNGSVLSLLFNNYKGAVHFLTKAAIMFRQNHHFLLFFSVMCHINEDYKFSYLRSKHNNNTISQQIQNVFYLCGYYYHEFGFVYKTDSPTEYTLSYQSALQHTKFVHNSLDSCDIDQIIARNHFLVIYGASLLKAGTYQEGIKILSPLYQQNNSSLPYLIKYLLIIWIAECHMNLAEYDNALSVLKSRYFRTLTFEPLPSSPQFNHIQKYDILPLPSSKEEALMNIDFNILVVKCLSNRKANLQKFHQKFRDQYLSKFPSSRLKPIEAIINHLLSQ